MEYMKALVAHRRDQFSQQSQSLSVHQPKDPTEKMARHQLVQMIAKLERDNRELQEQLIYANERAKKSYQQRCNADDGVRAKADLRTAARMVEDLKKRLASRSNQVFTLQGKINHLQREVIDLRHELESTNSLKEKAIIQYDHLRKQKEHDSKIDRIDEDHAMCRLKERKLKTQLKQAEERYQELKSRNDKEKVKEKEKIKEKQKNSIQNRLGMRRERKFSADSLLQRQNSILKKILGSRKQLEQSLKEIKHEIANISHQVEYESEQVDEYERRAKQMPMLSMLRRSVSKKMREQKKIQLSPNIKAKSRFAVY